MWLQRIRHGLKWRADRFRKPLKSARRQVMDRFLRGLIPVRWALRGWRQRPHGLPAPLIVSLTSVPARFGTLALTLKSLLSQSVRPDQVILWIAAEHQAALPADVRALAAAGLTIASCDNTLRSHNKYFHTRRQHPMAFIATADDDTYYWSDWLAELIADYDPRQRVIPGHRMHRIVLAQDGRPLPYRDWQWETHERDASPLIFPTGVGGVLYPPGCLHEDVERTDLILELCPRADDVWLYWMALRRGYQFRKTAHWRSLHQWRNSQNEGLMWGNVYSGTGNDDQINAMINAFTWPVRPTATPLDPISDDDRMTTR
jgi:hypothetical protein